MITENIKWQSSYILGKPAVSYNRFTSVKLFLCAPIMKSHVLYNFRYTMLGKHSCAASHSCKCHCLIPSFYLFIKLPYVCVKQAYEKTRAFIEGCTTLCSAERMTSPAFETVSSSDSAPSPTPRLLEGPPVLGAAMLKHQGEATSLKVHFS